MAYDSVEPSGLPGGTTLTPPHAMAAHPQQVTEANARIAGIPIVIDSL